MSKRAVFLDRDGVLNADVGYPHKVEDAVLFDDVLPTLRELNKRGLTFVVVSNQSGIGRGIFKPEEASRFNEVLQSKLNQGGVPIDRKDFYFCPHAPEDRCDCRKPAPGLILKAAQDNGLELSSCFLIGDKESDIDAGLSAGVQTIRLNRSRGHVSTRAHHLVNSLLDTVDIVCSAPRI
jgi:D-glycero-D-manno-heptose 1,7-bisphosphate phosphatase